MNFSKKITRSDFIRYITLMGVALVFMKYLFTGNKKSSEVKKQEEGTISFRVSAPPKK